MSYNINHKPVCVALVVASGSTYAGANLTSFTGVAKSLMINNLSAHAFKCKLNGDSNAVFTISASTSYSWDKGDLDITSVDFDNSASGSVTSTVEIIAGVVSA